MRILENKTVKEKAYFEELENGLKVIIIPKENTNKKMAIIGTKFGSIDNHFINPKTNEEEVIPDGVAHFLEHKMFEQANGTNSLDTLTAIGAEANAYTTNDHTAYYFETIDNFEPAFKELLNYVFHPYYTDENVEKEKGIITQEIKMYDDDPISKVFLNSLQCMYNSCPVRIDVAGTEESINKITKDTLNSCYNTFYHPSNMILAVCGNFKPEYILNLIKENMEHFDKQGKIQRIYPTEKSEIFQKERIEEMEVSIPAFVIGIKDEVENTDIIKKELPACPVEITMGLIGDKWKVLIIRDLLTGTKRFGELKKSLNGITQKVLTNNLRQMEASGLVNRKVYAEVPPRVEYSLTETGWSLKPILDSMVVWGNSYREKQN